MQNSIMHKNNKGQSVWDCPYIKENMKLRFFDKKNKCIGGKTKCVKMNETLNQWKAL